LVGLTDFFLDSVFIVAAEARRNIGSKHRSGASQEIQFALGLVPSDQLYETSIPCACAWPNPTVDIGRASRNYGSAAGESRSNSTATASTNRSVRYLISVAESERHRPEKV
jgi:hypothetical protein